MNLIELTRNHNIVILIIAQLVGLTQRVVFLVVWRRAVSIQHESLPFVQGIQVSSKCDPRIP